MARRGRAEKRDIPADGKYFSKSLQMFINKVMIDGKKSTAEGQVYVALERMEEQARRPAIDIFDQALRNATPAIEVKPRRAGYALAGALSAGPPRPHHGRKAGRRAAGRGERPGRCRQAPRRHAPHG